MKIVIDVTGGTAEMLNDNEESAQEIIIERLKQMFENNNLELRTNEVHIYFR